MKKKTSVRKHPRRTKKGKVTMVKNHKRTLKNKTLKRFMGDAMLENHPETKGLKIQKVYEQNGVIFAETEKAKAVPYKGWNFQVMFPRPIVEEFVPEIKLKKNRGMAQFTKKGEKRKIIDSIVREGSQYYTGFLDDKEWHSYPKLEAVSRLKGKVESLADLGLIDTTKFPKKDLKYSKSNLSNKYNLSTEVARHISHPRKLRHILNKIIIDE